MMRIPTLQSEHLTLRAPQPQDAAAIEQHLTDKNVSQGLARVPYPYPSGSAKSWIERQAKGIAGLHMAITHEDEMIGIIGLKPSSERQLGVFAPTIGYWLATPFWGKGFMEEAARRLLDWYMPNEPTERIRAAAFEDNKPSLNVLTKLGFTEVGRGSSFNTARGHDVPHVEFELTANNYYEAVR